MVFDREWAFTLIGRALAVLEGEHERKLEFYQTLKPWLDGAADELRHLIEIVSRG